MDRVWRPAPCLPSTKVRPEQAKPRALWLFLKRAGDSGWWYAGLSPEFAERVNDLVKLKQADLCVTNEALPWCQA